MIDEIGGGTLQARKELGVLYEFAELGGIATIDYLQSELSLIDRLDSMIDRCIKRVLLVSGRKSISPSASTAASGPSELPLLNRFVLVCNTSRAHRGCNNSRTGIE